MIARLKQAAFWLYLKMMIALGVIFCHRAIHGMLACLYGAGSAGASKEAIGYAVAACYAALFVWG